MFIFQVFDVLKTHNDKTRLELSAKGKSTKLNDILKLYSTISYTEDNNKKKIEDDIVFNFKILIDSLYYSEEIAELDVIKNFDNEKEKPVVTKKKLPLEDFVSFYTGSTEQSTSDILNKIFHLE